MNYPFKKVETEAEVFGSCSHHQECALFIAAIITQHYNSVVI